MLSNSLYYHKEMGDLIFTLFVIAPFGVVNPLEGEQFWFNVFTDSSVCDGGTMASGVVAALFWAPLESQEPNS